MFFLIHASLLMSSVSSLIGDLDLSQLSCPLGLEMNEDGVCCNEDGCCPDLPSGICCLTSDSDICCPGEMEFSLLETLLTNRHCCDGDNCCPVGGFSYDTDVETCCDSNGICCDLEAGECMCQNGAELTPIEGAAEAYEPNGCGLETWCEGVLKVVSRATEVWHDSCYDHDKCYVDCTKTQQECDDEFLESMLEDCNARYSGWRWFRRWLCKSAAQIAHSLIAPSGENRGAAAYTQGRQEYCTCPSAPTIEL